MSAQRELTPESKPALGSAFYYADLCPECMAETEYSILDLGEDNCFECSGCHKRVVPCDLCIHHTGCCGGGDTRLDEAIAKAIEGWVVLNTYVQDDLPEDEVELEKYCDTHSLAFALQKTDLEKILVELGEGWEYEKFMNEYIYCASEQVYFAAKGKYEMLTKVIKDMDWRDYFGLKQDDTSA